MTICTATTTKGLRCSKNALSIGPYCVFHADRDDKYASQAKQITSLQRTINQLTGHIGDIEINNANLKSSVDIATRELKNAVEINIKASDVVDQAKINIDKLVKTNDVLKNEADKLRNEAKSLQDRNKDLQLQKKEYDSIYVTNELLTIENQELRNQLNQSNKKSNNASQSSTNRERSLINRIKEYEQIVDRMKRELASANKTIDNMKPDYDRYQIIRTFEHIKTKDERDSLYHMLRITRNEVAHPEVSKC